MSFPPELVRTLLQELGCSSRGWLLDPFCGAGTTLIEAKLRGIPVIGVDANPFFVFASTVKTTLDLNPSKLLLTAEKLASQLTSANVKLKLKREKHKSKSVERGWVSQRSWNYSLFLLREIESLKLPRKFRDCLKLALITAVRDFCSRVKFGPELYKVKEWPKTSFKTAFVKKVQLFYEDLNSVPSSASQSPSIVLQGDARQLQRINGAWSDTPVRWVITSPPYPTEHDYTRISRLELELAGLVTSPQSLRLIKREMLRSNSKNIYSEDNDYQLVLRHTSIDG